MNYLAHIFLSGKHSDVLCGNFIGDIITLKNFSKLSDQVKLGVKLHQSIDSYTDAHKATKAAVKLFRPNHGHYAPVVADIAFDYFLVKNWELFSTESYSDYCNQIYPQLKQFYIENTSILPPYVERMIDSKWLEIYVKIEDLARVYKTVEKRVSKPEFLKNCTATLQQNEVMLNKLFVELFTDLIEHSNQFIIRTSIIRES